MLLVFFSFVKKKEKEGEGPKTIKATREMQNN
jgi:hypothetical protein